MRIHAAALLLSLPLGNGSAQGPVSLIALRTDDRVVALASRDGKALAREPLAFRCWRRGLGQRNETVFTDQDGLAVLELAPDLLPRSPILVLRGDGTCAVAAIEPTTPERATTATTAHLFVDRPVYRSGETVRGRVLLRESSVPVMGGAVELTLTLRDGTKLERALVTDLHGCACFAIELPEETLPGPVLVHARHRGFECVEHVFDVRAFRRPSVLCELLAAPVTKLDGSYLLDVHATFAAGGPAAGVEGRLVVQGIPRASFALDRDGRARVEVGEQALRPLAHLDRVFLAVELLGPDGVACRAEHWIEQRVALPIPIAANVGERLVVRVDGRPDELGLVCVANRALLATRVVRLDRDGRGEAAFTVERPWLPRVQILAQGTSGSWSCEPSDLGVSEPMSIALAEAGRRFAPGAEVELNLCTTDGEGRGKPSVLALAVVDEEVFAAFADRMRDPRDSLAPRLEPAGVRRQVTLSDSGRSLTLANLYLGGHLLGWPMLATVDGHGSAGGCAAPSPGSPSPQDSPPRSRFEATAAFLGAVATDADGRARVRIRMPDDLTRWRVTAVAVGGGWTAAALRAEISTEKELAVTAALPRFLREGDELVATRLVHHGQREVVASPLRLVGEGLGVLPLELSVREGALHDSLRVALPIRPAIAWLPWCTTATVAGPTELAPPPGVAAGEPCELVLLSGREAILAEAARFVGEYPYGCVEQTTSKLLPHLAALLAEPGTKQPERQQKIRAGLRRLRTMLIAPDRGFCYWPGWDRVDSSMSAYVVHALCIAREAGIDLARHGLALAPDRGELATLAKRVERCDPSLRDWDLDLAIALAHYGGGRGAHARALVATLGELALDGPQKAALALALSGEPARRAADAALAAVQARELRVSALAQLHMALRKLPGRGDDVGRLEARLLRRYAGGSFGTSFDTALAIVALTGPRPAETDGGYEVVVAHGRTLSKVKVGGGLDTARVPIPFSSPVVVTPPLGCQVVALLRGRLPLAAANPAVQQTLALTRRLVEPGSGREVRRFLARGQRVTLVLELSDTGAHDYVAIDCPIPAGFEVLGEPRGWEIHDDRVVFALAHTGQRPARAELTLVAAFAGEVAWPPATAFAMYDERQCAFTAAERLVVLDR